MLTGMAVSVCQAGGMSSLYSRCLAVRAVEGLRVHSHSNALPYLAIRTGIGKARGLAQILRLSLVMHSFEIRYADSTDVKDS